MSADLYTCYEALAHGERLGRDYRIEQRWSDPSTLVLAIHGGPIERYTDLVADRIAGTDLSFYALIGMKVKNNKKHLHVRSELFREPRALEMVRHAARVISIHGEGNNEEEFVMPGGLDHVLRDEIANALTKAGFTIKETPQRLKAENPCNICNCGLSGAGVQLELSLALRESMNQNADMLALFVQTIRAALGLNP